AFLAEGEGLEPYSDGYPNSRLSTAHRHPTTSPSAVANIDKTFRGSRAVALNSQRIDSFVTQPTGSAESRPMNRRLVPILTILAALAAPVTVAAAATPNPGPPDATVKIKVGHLRGGKAQIYSKVPVTGTLEPFVTGQHVAVTFYLNGHK